MKLPTSRSPLHLLLHAFFYRRLLRLCSFVGFCMIWSTLLHVVTVSVATLLSLVSVRLAEVSAAVGETRSVFFWWIAVCTTLALFANCVDMCGCVSSRGWCVPVWCVSPRVTNCCSDGELNPCERISWWWIANETDRWVSILLPLIGEGRLGSSVTAHFDPIRNKLESSYSLHMLTMVLCLPERNQPIFWSSCFIRKTPFLAYKCNCSKTLFILTGVLSFRGNEPYIILIPDVLDRSLYECHLIHCLLLAT